MNKRLTRSTKKNIPEIGKRLFSIFLVLVMIVSMASVAPKRAEAAGYDWRPAGNTGKLEKYNNRKCSFDLDSKGTPYAAYINSDYKIVVKKYDGNSWVNVGDTKVTSYECVLKIGRDDKPYIFYRDKEDFPYAIQYNGNKWNMLGNGKVKNEWAAYDLDIAFDQMGGLYVAYKGCNADYGACVVRLNHGKWETVGTYGFSSGKASHIKITFNPEGNLYALYVDDSKKGKLTMKKYDAAKKSWAYVGSGGFTSGQSYLLDFVVGADDVPYVLYVDYNTSQIIAMTYKNGTWKKIGGEALAKGNGGYNSPLPSIITDGTAIYMSYIDNVQNGHVKKYKDGQLSDVGGSLSDASEMSLLLNKKDGTLYVAKRSGNKITIESIQKLPAKVTNVSSPAVNGSYKTGDTISISIAFDEAVQVTGTPVISLKTGTSTNTASYTSGSGTDTLVFCYTVQAGDKTSDLDYSSTSALTLNGGSIKDSKGSDAVLTLPSPGAKGSLGANKEIILDTAGPTVSITSSEASPTNKKLIPVTITFNEEVSGFELSDLSVGNGEAKSLQTVSKKVYTADIEPDQDGKVTVDVAAKAVKDAAGNESSAATQFTITSDQTAPTVSITSSEAATTSAAEIPVMVYFSENVTGFGLSDVKVGNGIPTEVTAVSGGAFQVKLQPEADGKVTVDIAKDAAEDEAGNGNSAAKQFSIISDRTAPVFLDGKTVSSDITNNSAKISAEISESGTIYYLVTAKGAKPPTAAQVKTGSDYDSVTLIAHGSKTVIESPYTVTFPVTGLSAGTDYDIYLAAEDQRTVPNLSKNPVKTEISTLYLPITGFDAIEDFDAGYAKNTSYPDTASIIAALPKTVTAKVNGKTVSIPVSTWEDTDKYDAAKVGSYTFTAVLGTLPAGYKNENNYTASIEVCLANETFKITYNANGGSGSVPVDSKKYIEGEKVTLTGGDSLQRAHYSFTGWSLSPDGDILQGSYTMERADVTFYAQWAEHSKYSVTYDVNGGSGSVPVDTKLYYQGDTVLVASGSAISVSGSAISVSGSAISVSGSALTLANHSFGGWSLTPDGGAVGSVYTMGDSDVIFYAVWIEDGKYTVIYDANGGSGEIPSDGRQYYAGESITLQGAGGLEKKHYRFAGWSLTAGGEAIANTSYTIGEANLTLYAVWEEMDTYHVIYDANGGSGSVPVDSKEYYTGDSLIPKAAVNLQRSGYTFQGWSLQADGSVVGKTFVMGEENLKLYAIWKKNTTPYIPATTDDTDNTESIRKAGVNGIGALETDNLLSIDIIRKNLDGKTVDSAVLTAKDTKNALSKAIKKEQKTLQIVISDAKDAPADEVAITVHAASVQEIAKQETALEICTDKVDIRLEKKTLSQVGETGEDLYFRLIPVKEEEKRSDAVKQALTSQIMLANAGNSQVEALGTPMTIETNYKTMDAKLSFSLKDIVLPEGEEERKAYLDNLAVYICHSDGEEEVNHGTIVYDEDGNPMALEIEINKFSTFTLVNYNNEAPEVVKAVIKGKAKAGKTITAAYTYRDTEADAEGNTQVQWYRADNKKGKNRKKIKGASQLSYMVEKKDQGKYLICQIIPKAESGAVNGEAVVVAVKVAKASTVKEKAVKPSAQSRVKLGVIGSKEYAGQVADLFKKYEGCTKADVKPEGKYYRVVLEFTDKALADKASKSMKEKKYIINYYFTK